MVKNNFKPTLLHVVEAMGGGVFTYLVDLSNALCDRYNIYIAYAVREQTPNNFKDFFDERVKFIEIKDFCRAINPHKDLMAYFEVKKAAKEIHPDIIHLHSSKAGALGRFAFNTCNAAVFYTPHGYSFLMKDCGCIRRFIYKSIETICGRKNCTTISCSEGEHMESLKLNKHAQYVNNGINTEKLDKLIGSLNAEKNHPFTVFTLGRICYQKNPSLFNSVAKAIPDIRFLWIGDGELKNELTAPNIEVTGWVDREKALSYSIDGDVFILTSLWEGLPISLLEAMYMKKLCVVSNAIGNKDVIHNGVNGYVCSDVGDFVKAIDPTADNREYIKNAYNDVIEKYNTNVMAQSYSNLYISKWGGVQPLLNFLYHLWQLSAKRSACACFYRRMVA